jgi:hypothetical protein
VLNEPENINDDFSPALRRHLRGRVAVECSGIDADLAAAYLERALTGLVCRQFEDHLAGCPPCRRGLLELSQLDLLFGGDTAPAVVSQAPLPQADRGRRMGDWLRGFDLAGLLGLRGGFSLPMVGLASAAVVLIVSGVVWQLRREPATGFSQQIAVNQNSLPGDLSRTQSVESPAAVVTEGGINKALESASQELPANLPRNQKDTLAGKLPAIQSVSQSDVAESGARRAATGLQARSSSPDQKRADQKVSNLRVSDQRVSDLKGSDLKGSDLKGADLKLVVMPNMTEIPPMVAVSRLVPKPEDNPMRILQLPESRSRRLAEDSSQFRYGRMVGGFMPQGRARLSTELTDRLNSAQVRRILDKTFTFNGHSWVDDAYQNLTTVSGTVNLSVGDATYDKLVAEFPVLRDYFSLRPVVLVWRGRVYRVSGQVSGR